MVREYYQMRESRFLLGLPYTPLRFRAKLLNHLTAKPLYRPLAFPDRKERLSYYRRAARDARSGYAGEYAAIE